MDNLPHEKLIQEYIKTIENLKKQHQDNPIFTSEIQSLEEKLEVLKKQVYANLTPWERVLICRHPSRPHTIDFITHICDDFLELAGDRYYKDDHSLIAGFATIDNQHFVVIGQEKGNSTESRMHRNFGMLHPEGFRKALRIMQLAEKFQLPIISFLDTPGAYPGLEAEERGQGWAIAYNLREMMRLRTPIIVIVIGEGCSGGALGIGIGDKIAMLEHSYYSVISPEGCASILWKDTAKNKEAAIALKLNAEDLLAFNVIDADGIIPEPLGGAHQNPLQTYQNVKSFILQQNAILQNIPLDDLIQARYEKFRQMGKYAEEV